MGPRPLLLRRLSRSVRDADIIQEAREEAANFTAGLPELRRPAAHDALLQHHLARAMAEDRRSLGRRRLRRRQGRISQYRRQRRARQPPAGAHRNVVHGRILDHHGGRALVPHQRQVQAPRTRTASRPGPRSSSITRSRSRTRIGPWSSPDDRRYNPAYEGAIWIDKETRRVLRIEQHTTGMPQDFPLLNAETVLTYAFVKIDGKPYLLPAGSENLGCSRGSGACTRNTIEFKNYKKFSAESTVTFGK